MVIEAYSVFFAQERHEDDTLSCSEKDIQEHTTPDYTGYVLMGRVIRQVR